MEKMAGYSSLSVNSRGIRNLVANKLITVVRISIPATNALISGEN